MAEEKSNGKVQTGIPGLDGLIEDGLEEKSVIIVSGDAGCGKTTLALQFLYNGITKFDEPGLYITFEEQKSLLYKHMKRFGWDFAALEKQKKFSIYEYPPHDVDRFISEGGIIEDLINERGIKRVVIDSITSFILLYDTEYKKRQAFLKTMETLRKWGCTCLLTAEGKTMPDGSVETRFGLEFLADGLIALHTIRRGDMREIALEVVKLRGVAHEHKICPLKITEKGLVIFPSQPVFGELG